MQIEKIVLFEYKRPFKLPFVSPHTSRTSAESIVLQLVFENGISGYGESAPRDYVTGETCVTVVRLVEEVFAPTLFSSPVGSLKDTEKILDKLEQACLDRAVKHYTSALGAVDIALLDALGKSEGLPVARYLGSMREEIAPLSISLPFVPLETIEGLFAKYRNLDLKHIKILLGQDEEENLDRVMLLRRLLGDDVDLRLEVNGKWSFDQAVSNLERMEGYGISSVEEPLSSGDTRGFQELKKRIGLDIVMDESMCSIADARALLDADACDVFNIKISKCGGLLRSRAIARFAEKRGIPCHLGCHVGESEILGQAARHFAFTTPNLRYIEGYTMLLFEGLEKIAQKGAGMGKSSEIRNCRGLGLSRGGRALREKWLRPLNEFGP